MPTVTLPRVLAPVTPELRLEIGGDTLAEALEDLFDRAPGLRVHLMDEAGALRAHVSCFVNGVADRLDDRTAPLGPSSRIDFIQAVSGGS